MENNTTVEERQKKDKLALLTALKEMPIVEVACKRAGVSRATYYRWRKEDKDFLKQSDDAMAEGVEFINDMGESQLVSLMREKSWPAISFWLRKRNPKFLDRIEITANIRPIEENLTPEQKEDMEEALRHAELPIIKKINSNKNESTESKTE